MPLDKALRRRQDIRTMARISIWVGLGLMLVGAIFYLLMPTASSLAFIPFLGGLFMVLAGLICIANYHYRLPMLLVSLSIAGFLLLSGLGGMPFALMMLSQSFIPFVAILDVIILSGLFWFFGFGFYLESVRKKKNESMVAANRAKREELGGK